MVLVREGEEVGERIDFIFAFKDESGVVEGVDGVVLAIAGSGWQGYYPVMIRIRWLKTHGARPLSTGGWKALQ